MHNTQIARRVFLKLINFCLYRNNINNRREPVTAGSEISIVFYDHACVLCRAEMLRLKARDRHARLSLIDISGSDFDAWRWGVQREAFLAALHVLTPANEWLRGMPAIRHVYGRVGLGWLLAPTAWPGLSALATFAYHHFARNRVVLSRWFGRVVVPTRCTDATCVRSAAKPEGGEHV